MRSEMRHPLSRQPAAETTTRSVRHYYGDWDDPGYGMNSPFLCRYHGLAVGRPFEEAITQVAAGPVLERVTGCEQSDPARASSIRR